MYFQQYCTTGPPLRREAKGAKSLRNNPAERGRQLQQRPLFSDGNGGEERDEI